MHAKIFNAFPIPSHMKMRLHNLDTQIRPLTLAEFARPILRIFAENNLAKCGE